MAGQSITFDFLTTGADRTASDFRKTGDNAVLAAKGAKILSNVIETLGDKEGRTAEESVLLAKALRQTGDAADRTTARMVLADASIRRLGDAMQDSSKKSDGLRKSLSGLKLNPGLVGPALLLAPALASLTGVAAGAAVALGGAFVAGGAALAAFGAVAKPVLSDAKTAAAAVEKAQNNYTAAIAGGTKQSVAYKAEQIAIAKAYANLSPAQVALSKQLGAMASSWDAVKAAQTPVVAGALQPWLKSVTDLTKQLGPIIAKVAPVIGYLGGQFDALVRSPEFKAFRDFIGSTGAAAVSAGGSTIIDLVKAFITLLPKFDPLIREAIGWISRLGPAVLKWSESKKASDGITKFMQWFSQNGHVVGDLIRNVGGALKALAPGLVSGGVMELKLVSDFLGLVAKLPPALAKPLAEVAGALLILNKLGVVKVGFKLLGMDAATAAAGGGGAGLWGKALPGVRFVGGALLAEVAVIMTLKSIPNKGDTGVKGQQGNWWETPFNMPGPKSSKSASNWLTSWSPYINTFKKNIAGMAAFFTSAWNTMWANTVTGAVEDWKTLVAVFDSARHQIAHIWDVLTNDIAKSFDIAANYIGIAWDHVKLSAFDAVKYILNIMSKLPGPLGAPFRTAAKDIGNSMAGVQADIARRTGQIQADINSIHGKDVPVVVHASGTGAIRFFEQGVIDKTFQLMHLKAAGGMIPGAGNTDSFPALLTPGEVVVPKQMVAGGAVDHLRGRLPGFAAGGLAGMVPATAAAEQAAASNAAEAATRATYAAALAATKKLMFSSGSAIVAYARSFLGKIPYVFGGNSLTSGIDCSGFTKAIYSRFGIHAPRTSEAQYGWARKSGPVPGALAFYVSPAGGPPPGHVAIVQDASTVISQGGGMGPTLMGLHAMPLMGTGVPSGGLPGSAGGVGNQAPIVGGGTGTLQQIAQTLLRQRGWIPQWPSFNALENREAGWNMFARNPSSGAYGLAQFINGPSEYYQYGGNPDTGAGQLTAMMSYIGQRYPSGPDAAWNHESLFGWYDRGGWLPRGLSLAYNGTGRPEQVIPHGGRGGGGTVVLENHGVIGSRLELENWLVRSIDAARRKGRI